MSNKLRFDEDEMREFLKSKLDSSLIETIIYTLKIEKCNKWCIESSNRLDELVRLGTEIIASQDKTKVANFNTQVVVANETHRENMERLNSLLAINTEAN